MLNAQACSSFSLRIHPHQERGFVLPFQEPVNKVHSIWKGKHGKYSFGYCSSRFSSLASNQENIENLPLKPYGLEHERALKPEGGHQTNIWTCISKQLSAFYRFCYPKTVIFHVVAITSVSLLPVETMADLSLTFFMGILKAVVTTILMHIYVVGVNQLFDINIDKVNKPYLPLASGDFSMGTGVAITLTACLLSFAMGFMFQSLELFCGLVAYFLYGTIYSVDLPFLRWKRDPLLTTIIATFWFGVGLQIPYFVYFQKFVLGKPIVFKQPLIFSIAMMSLFAIFISSVKDISDVDGDRENGIDTFAIRFGKEKVLSRAVNMLLMGYGLSMLIGSSSSFISSKLVTVLGHFTFAFILWVRAKYVDTTDKSTVESFYGFVWKLFSAECLLIPFAR